MSNIAFTAPHFRASEVGLKILKSGGTAVDAMIAAAAMVSVQYPHMNSLGGDGFWLIQRKGELPIAIDGCGYASESSTIERYSTLNLNKIPERGPNAAFTMAGTVAGWQKARDYISASHHLFDLKNLLQPSIDAARSGFVVTESLLNALTLCLPIFTESETSKNGVLSKKSIIDFNEFFTKNGKLPKLGEKLSNIPLAQLFSDLSEYGLDSFYRGKIAENLAKDLDQAGSSICLGDFHSYKASIVEPLSVQTSVAKLFNLGAPTQGLASLIILAIYDRLHNDNNKEADDIHLLVEATKQAFLVRDEHVADPGFLSDQWDSLLDKKFIDQCVNSIQMDTAMPWPQSSEKGDTVWMGATDQYGTMVSFIQSIYWEFGSGLVLPSYGLLWNNRGVSFSLSPEDRNALAPRKKPRHTLNPALAELNNGDRMVYGAMGGEGQPQTHAALFKRHVYQNYSLDKAINSPRWLLGRTWGDENTSLKIEKSLFDKISTDLKSRGHLVEPVNDFNELMGHAGAIRLTKNGDVEAATDQRSDGAALVFP